MDSLAAQTNLWGDFSPHSFIPYRFFLLSSVFHQIGFYIPGLFFISDLQIPDRILKDGRLILTLLLVIYGTVAYIAYHFINVYSRDPHNISSHSPHTAVQDSDGRESLSIGA